MIISALYSVSVCREFVFFFSIHNMTHCEVHNNLKTTDLHGCSLSLVINEHFECSRMTVLKQREKNILAQHIQL